MPTGGLVISPNEVVTKLWTYHTDDFSLIEKSARALRATDEPR